MSDYTERIIEAVRRECQRPYRSDDDWRHTPLETPLTTALVALYGVVAEPSSGDICSWIHDLYGAKQTITAILREKGVTDD